MLSVVFHAMEFLAYHIILSVVDRVSRLPWGSTPQPKLMRLYRENIALESQVRALVIEKKAMAGKKPKVLMRTRAAQVLAYLFTRATSVQDLPGPPWPRWTPQIFERQARRTVRPLLTIFINIEDT